MKTYRIVVLDFTRAKGRLLSMKYVKGLSAARSAVPVKLHFCRNAGAFVGYAGGLEYWVIAC